MSADMRWTIESPAGAVIAGTCVDGWDQANVQISTDEGATWIVIDGSDPYDFDCGYGTVYNGYDGAPGLYIFRAETENELDFISKFAIVR